MSFILAVSALLIASSIYLIRQFARGDLADRPDDNTPVDASVDRRRAA
ncbi:MAG: hypothetical protein HYX50_00855 [Chloroflexi bacterium]|nr:hypothetical protein [Chloroflexota bacterium]